MNLNRENNNSFWTNARWSRRTYKIYENSENSLLQSQREIQPSRSPVVEDTLKPQPSFFNGESTIFLLFIPLLFLCIGLIYQIGLQKFNKNRLKFFEHHPQIACRQCQFFDNNHYLKCAVHPDKVLTIEARDCHDYQEKK